MQKGYTDWAHLVITLVAMAIIGILGYGALMRSIDGGCFFGMVAAISGLAGYEIKWYRERSKNGQSEE